MGKDYKNKKYNKKNQTNGRNNEDRANQNKRCDGAYIAARQDPFWYAKDEKAIKDMASFPWNEIVGNGYEGSKITGEHSDCTPGAVIYPVWHCLSTNDLSTENYLTRAADSYYQYVTQGFAAGVNFEAPDLLFTAIAAESLMSLLIEGKRAYGMMKYYLQNNKYYAEVMLSALGFNYADLKAHLAEFRSEYNIRVAQINALVAVPKSFFLGDRWEYLSSWIFTDTSSPEYSTAYAYRIDAALKYEATAATTGTCLSWSTRAAERLTVQQFFSWVDSLILALTDSDARDIFGALRKVYSPDQLKVVSDLTEDFTTTVVQNDVIAMAIHNALPLNKFASILTAVNTPSKQIPISQGTNGAIMSNVYGTYAGGKATIGSDTLPLVYLPTQVMLDMYDHEVTPGNVLDATANMAALIEEDATVVGDEILYRVVCRSEILATPMIYYFATNEDVWHAAVAPLYLTSPTYSAGPGSITSWNSNEAMRKISWFSHVDSHTLMRVLYTPEKKTINIDVQSAVVFFTRTVQRYLGEIDRYTFVSIEALTKLHNKSQFQLLSMPANSKSITH